MMACLLLANVAVAVDRVTPVTPGGAPVGLPAEDTDIAAFV
jgi:hypothetical protein